MNRKQKKLVLTQKGKIAIGLAIALSIIVSFIGVSYFVEESSESSIPASVVYSYSMNHMVSESMNKENDARELLRENINKADKLLEDSEGKVFDSSRANLEIYLQNIRNVPDSQKVESNNIVDYINSEKRIRGFINSLYGKTNDLQESYNDWNQERETLTNDQTTLQEEIDTNSGNNSELEELLREKQEAGNTAETTRNDKLEELSNERRNSRPSVPSAPPAPVERPTTTPEPSTPSPSKTPEPTEKPSVAPTPTPSPTQKPTPPKEDLEPTEKPDPEKPTPTENTERD